MDNNNQNQKGNFFYALSLGLELGFLVVAPLVIFLVLGLFLDRKLGTTPLFLISFIILSLIATFFEVKILILPFLEKKVGKNKNNGKNQ